MTKAEIHPNLHLVDAGEDACISLKEMKKYARVRNVATAILSDVEFVVQASGRKKAVEDKQRNVHAWARGTLVGEYPTKIDLADFEVPESIKNRFREVSYHYEVGHFFDVQTKTKVTSARTVYAVGDKCFYLPK